MINEGNLLLLFKNMQTVNNYAFLYTYRFSLRS